MLMISLRLRDRGEVGGDFVKSALGAGDDFVGAKAFKNFGELVKIAADHDFGAFVAVAGAFGDQKGGLDVVGGNDNGGGALDSRLDEGAFLLGIIDNDRFAGTHQVVNGQGIAFDEHIGTGVVAEMIDDARTQVAVTDDDDVIFHLSCEHAAALLGVVALDGLKKEKRNNNSEKDALPPERIKLPKLTRVHAQVEGAEERFA